ncbi:MAG: TIM barrel protein [Chitinophagaceae bacterium]|nr:TIM barrel protein [Chitinophagaceae bacterium]
MQRRTFLQKQLGAGAALAMAPLAGMAAAGLSPAEQPFQRKYAFHDGMFRQHAGDDFLEQIRFGYNQGFRAIEDNGMMTRTPDMQEKIGNLLQELQMEMGVFVVAFDNWPLQTSLTSGKKEWQDKFVRFCQDAVAVAKRCHAKWMTVVPGNYERQLPMGIQTANVIDALRKGADVLAKHNLVMVLEPLSDTPDLFLRHSTQTYEICKAVNSPACKILFDMYHMQRNEGDIIRHIDWCWDEIAYFQIGDNPGRKEPGTGEMNYRNIFKHLYTKGYRGILGMEHGNAQPGKEGELALIQAYREADRF